MPSFGRVCTNPAGPPRPRLHMSASAGWESARAQMRRAHQAVSRQCAPPPPRGRPSDESRAGSPAVPTRDGLRERAHADDCMCGGHGAHLFEREGEPGIEMVSIAHKRLVRDRTQRHAQVAWGQVGHLVALPLVHLHAHTYTHAHSHTGTQTAAASARSHRRREQLAMPMRLGRHTETVGSTSVCLSVNASVLPTVCATVPRRSRRACRARHRW
jgi:hypothetical protein